jgi:serine/threonine protein kinase
VINERPLDLDAGHDAVVMTRAFAGRFELIDRLGTGGLGELFRVRENTTRLPLALRLTIFPGAEEILAALGSVVALHTTLAADGLPIVRVVAAGVDEEGSAWYAMELVEGESILSAVRRHGPMPVAKAVPLLQQLTLAVQALHDRKVLHQDLSSRNVFLDSGSIRILELRVGAALARALQERPGALTSPRAKAPEQLVADAEPRTDIYAIGCIAYYVLTGRKAIADGAANLRLATIGGMRPPRLENIVPALRPILARMLAMRPEDRFGSAAELSQALGAVRFAQ